MADLQPGLSIQMFELMCRCLKELSDLPDEDREAQIQECMQLHGLDPSKLNVMLFGSVKAGKSTFGSSLVGKKPTEGDPSSLILSTFKAKFLPKAYNHVFVNMLSDPARHC